MRKRVHRSAIMFATLLAWLLVTPDRASADGVTVIVPVNVTNLQEQVSTIYVHVVFVNDQNVIVGSGVKGILTPDGSCQEDLEISVSQGLNRNIFDAATYRIFMTLKSTETESLPSCAPNVVDQNQTHCNAEFSQMQMYESQQGPISDLIPE